MVRGRGLRAPSPSRYRPGVDYDWTDQLPPGLLQGMLLMLGSLWAYSLAHPWVFALAAGLVLLKVIEVRTRGRRGRR